MFGAALAAAGCHDGTRGAAAPGAQPPTGDQESPAGRALAQRIAAGEVAFAAVQQDVVFRLQPPGTTPPPDHLTERGPGGLVVAIGLLRDDGWVALRQSWIERWNVDAATVLRVARANLGRRLEREQFTTSRTERGPVLRLQSSSPVAASYIYLRALWNRAIADLAGREPVVAIPSQSVIVVVGRGNENAVTTSLREEYARQPLLGSFVRWPPGADLVLGEKF